MDPRTGDVVDLDALDRMRKLRDDQAERFTVRLEGSPEDIQAISRAVRRQTSEVRRKRRRNKAARIARRNAR